MTNPDDITQIAKAMREAAEACAHTGSWGAPMSAANVIAVLDRLAEVERERDEARAEVLEQARLNGMGAGLEAWLLGKIARLEREANFHRARSSSIVAGIDAATNGNA